MTTTAQTPPLRVARLLAHQYAIANNVTPAEAYAFVKVGTDRDMVAISPGDTYSVVTETFGGWAWQERVIEPEEEMWTEADYREAAMEARADYRRDHA